jgi:hypothetical protein
MRIGRVGVLNVLALVGVGVLSAQSYAPPPVQMPDEATLKKIKDKTAELGKALAGLRRQGVETKEGQREPTEEEIDDIEIYHKAARWIVQHQEWYNANYAKWTLETLDQGLVRAKKLREQGYYFDNKTAGRVVRGYRSSLDGSVQPYGLILPKNYPQKADLSNYNEDWRLEVILHGRDASLTEVKFLHQFADAPPPADLDHIELHIYGRGNNAYRWAGEVDVFEALEHCLSHTGRNWLHPSSSHASKARPVGRWLGRIGQTPDIRGEIGGGLAQMLNEDHVILRGFSMGGAGAWHLGLHHPDRWRSVSPGAGFTTTHGYVKNLPEKLPAYQEACLHIYDAVDYAENAVNVPIVAYGGERDPQLQAAKNIEAKLKPLGIPMTLLVGPDTEHRYHPESLKQIQKLQAEHAAKKRDNRDGFAAITDPKHVRFVTFTPQFSECYWVKVLAQEKQFERSLVDAEFSKERLKVKTDNVRLLMLTVMLGESEQKSIAVEIDGEKLNAGLHPLLTGEDRDRPLPGTPIVLQKREGKWSTTILAKALTDAVRQPQKDHRLMGPIDVAFTQPFLCVRGDGKPWHEATGKYVEADLQRFQQEWHKFFRGDLPVKDAMDVDTEDLLGRHLVLFGDPSSNPLIAYALDRLPLKWTRERIEFAGQSVTAADHVPVMIFPSPFNPEKYLVLNTGHTFHAKDFEGTNALLYPRLGDYALLKLKGDEKDPLAVEVVTAGLFDEKWQVAKAKE